MSLTVLNLSLAKEMDIKSISLARLKCYVCSLLQYRVFELLSRSNNHSPKGQYIYY